MLRLVYALRIFIGLTACLTHAVSAPVDAEQKQLDVDMVPLSLITANPWTQPRMSFSPGCASSSFVMTLAVRLFSLHHPGGVANSSSSLGGLELTKCENNDFCTLDTSGRHGHQLAADPTAMIQSIRRYVTDTHGESTLLFKGSQHGFTNELAAALHTAETHAVATVRANALDMAICEVRDGFHPDATWSMLIDPATGEQWQAPDADPSSNAHFARRRMPREAQPLVWLNISMLRQVLDAHITDKEQMHETMAGFGWPDAAVLTTEDLLAHRDDVERATGAWTQLLRSWDVEPNVSAIREDLRTHASNVHAESPTNRSLYNSEEVLAALTEWGPAYTAMYRPAE